MKHPTTLIDLLDRRFEQDSAKIAYVFLPSKDKAEQTMTYGDLAVRCNAITGLLSEATRPGDRVLLVHPPGLGFIEAFFGCLRAGRVPVPVGTVKPNRPGNHLESIRRNCSPAAVLAQRPYYDSLARKAWVRECLQGLPVLFNEDAEDSASHVAPFAATPDSLAFLQYTSGSTLEPRGVVVTHANVLANARLIQPSFGFDADSRGFSWLPFFHDMGLIGHLLFPIYYANPSFLMPPIHFLSEPIQWLRGIARFKATFSGGPNFAYDLCVERTTPAEREGLDLSSWTVAYNGSEPVSPRTMRRFAEAFAPYGFRKEHFLPCYGMAECTLFVSGKPYGGSDHFVATTRKALAEGNPLEAPGAEVELVSCGTSWPGQTIAIVDPDQLSELPAGRIGEIWVAGPHVSGGYWENIEKTAESFGRKLEGRAESFLCTGDVGFMDAAGRLYISGRRKEVLIVRGKNHYPQDLEETAQNGVPNLLPHRGAVFTQVGDEPAHIVLVQELKRKVPVSAYESLAASIREQVLVAHGVTLHEVVLVGPGHVPLTSSGKIQRLKCRDLLAEGTLPILHRSSLAAAPERSAQQDTLREAQTAPGVEAILEQLAKLVRKHGPRKDVAVDATGSFSRYGLDSVASVALLADLGSWLNRSVEAPWIWEFPSLGQLATHLAQTAAVSHRNGSPVDPAPVAGRPAPAPDAPPLRQAAARSPTRQAAGLQFSLLFFAGEDELDGEKDRYHLLMEASRFADQNGFHAIWVPERHFHAFGGLYPSPSVLAAALARETDQVRLRSGSVVLPLHNPVRVAEEWSLVDNLSGGRVDLGFAQGWNANDFVLAPSAYADRKEIMFQGVGTIQKLWRGEAVALPNGRGETVPVRIHPTPLQRELCVWITCSGDDERFVEAGRGGFNILTALLFQPKDELFRKIKLYRNARAAAGHPGTGEVTLMLHTYLHPDPAHVKRTTRAPFLRYLETSTSLWRQEWDALKSLSEADREKALDIAYERYARTTALMGTPESASETCALLRENGVDEIACLIDFGLPMDEVMSSLVRVASLAGRENARWNPGKAARAKHVPHRDFEPIAVIGVAAQVAGAETADALWENLKRGVDSVGPMPPGRWPHDRPGEPSFAALPEFPKAGWLPRVDLFDAKFFRVSPHEASVMDPQQRLFLETAWTCIQDAGYSGPDLQGRNVGVYVGAAGSRYESHFRWNGIAPDAHMLAGNTVCTLPARLSYHLDLRGPCLALDTACSSSLVAIHEACRALGSGECEAAIAGGVSLLLTPDLFQVAGKAGMLSSRGECRAFDASADGYVPGEGVGAVFLKPLSAALRDGDSIYGVIRGSALNHDGATNGITAPNPTAQVEVAREALRRAGATPDSIGYVECHGTGTLLGDPIEFKALQEIYGGRAEPLPIGSIKSNIGHLLAAAGVASFLKALYSLKHRLLVPSLHFEQPNPHLNYGRTSLRVVTEVAPEESQSPRRAAVSSFGHSGTNCTVILEEFVGEKPAQFPAPEPCVVSGRNPGELRAYLERLSAHLMRARNVSVASIARTLALGRTPYPCRAAFVAASAGELAVAMREALALDNPASPGVAVGDALLRARHDARAGAALAAVLAFLDGGDPDWEQALPPATRAHLPAYPLHPTSHWARASAHEILKAATPRLEAPPRLEARPAPTNAGQLPHRTTQKEKNGAPRLDDSQKILRDLRGLLARLLECEADDIDAAASFLDIGADSLILMDVQGHLQTQYGLKLPVGDFFEAMDTLEKLQACILAHVAANPSAHAAPGAAAPDAATAPANVQAAGREATLPGWATPSAPLEEIDPTFVAAYCAKTPRSKRTAQDGRDVLADNRASAGFRVLAKELVYPLVAEQGQGAQLEDMDGNRYLDITMGFGVHLFGHNPAFIRDALSKAIQRGFVLGPNSPLAGDVARRIARVTGHDRVAFFNSGTEAVMSALRLARNFTGKGHVALFSHSYHGHSDGVLAYPDGGRSRPAVPGVPDSAVAASTVLPYGDPTCFERLEAMQADLAAVLVEPVQARNPGHQPFEFLARLREWTRKRGVLLIFDEMITGFRVAAGGVQELLGFNADLAAYGKIVGGGMPIGIIAGDKAIMDGVDGGYWSYGEASAPTAPTTFFAGTFSKHPLALEAASAALGRIESAGREFYPRLNEVSDDACRRLNETFQEEGYPGEVRNFGSLFRFFLKGKQDVFFYRLVMNGVYVWEGRNCFLSTEHGPPEVDRLVAAVRDSVRAKRVAVHATALAGASDAPGTALPSSIAPPEAGFPALDSQRQLWALAQIDPARFSAYNECQALRLTGSVDTEGLRAGCAYILGRHELLRSRLSEDGASWRPCVDAEVPFSIRDIQDELEAKALIAQEKRRLFDIHDGPLWSVVFLRLPDGTGYLLSNFHHLVVDGWSFSVLLEDIAAAYGAHRAQTHPDAPPAVPFSRFVAHQRHWLASVSSGDDATVWRDSLAGYAPGAAGAVSSVEAGAESQVLSAPVWKALKASARRLGATPSSLLLSAYLPLLWEWRGSDDVVVAVPVSARTFPGSSRIVGYCAHVMPLRFAPGSSGNVGALVAETQQIMAAGLSRQDYPFSNILTDYRKAGGSEPGRLAALGFNLDRNLRLPALDGAHWTLADSPATAIDSEINLSFLEHHAGVSLCLQYRLATLDQEQAARWVRQYLALLSALGSADPGASWRDLAAAAGITARRPPARRAEAAFAFEMSGGEA